jgi:hypothetical protein
MSLVGKMGRLGQMYVVPEVTYGVAPALVATNAFRHLAMDLAFSPRNRQHSLEKKQSPGRVNRFTRRMSGSWNLSQAYMIPSGTLNTLPEADPFFTYGMGQKTNRTLATTFTGTPTITTGTVASAGALAVNDLVLVGQGTNRWVRLLTAVAGAALTWTPAVPVAPTAGDSLTGGVTYQLATDVPTPMSLFLAWYIGTFGRGGLGAAVDKLKFSFDATKEAEFAASGPLQSVQSSASGPAGAVQAQPGAFTTVGAGNGIPSGIAGQFFYNSAAYIIMSASFDLTNNIKLRNENFGSDRATEAYRAGRRDINVMINARLEDPTQVYADGESTTPRVLALQNGVGSGSVGKIWGIVCPNVEFELPNTPDGEEALTWAFKGIALESADSKNDELFLGAF